MNLKKAPFSTGIVIVSILVFGISVLAAGTTEGPRWTSTLLRLGAQFNPLSLDKEWYRIFTYSFLHGSVVHLSVNAALLLYLGATMEARAGSKKFAFVYLVTALAAALASLFWNVFTIGVGSSGAIAGMLGFSLVYNTFIGGRSARPMLLLLCAFLLFLAVNLVVPDLAYADHVAHFGGVVAGIAVGFCSFAGAGKSSLFKVKAEYVMIALLLIMYFAIPRSQVRYFRFFRQLVAAEDTTDYIVRRKLTDDDMRVFIRNHHQWEEIEKRLRSQTNLPVVLTSDTSKLGRYIHLRKQENLFRKLVVQHEAYIYLDSVERIHERMRRYQELDYALWRWIKVEDNDAAVDARMLKVLYDSTGAEVAGPRFAYARVGVMDSLGRWNGAVRDYDPLGNLRMKGVYDRGKREGVFMFYDARQRCERAGRYVTDREFGKWQTFYSGGNIASEVFYGDGIFVRNVWDSLGNQMVVDGNGREIRRYANGVVALEGEYRHGVKEGYWYGRHPDGTMYFEEQFNGGALVSGRSRSLNGEMYVYDASSLSPIPEGGYEKFYAYVRDQVRSYNSPDAGYVKIRFRVSREADITDISIAQGGIPGQEQKARSILINGPHWLPARNHGHEPIDEWATVLIGFY